MEQQTSRRAFVKGSFAAAATTMSTRISQADQDANARTRAIDTHQHLWDLSKFTLPWTKSAKELSRNFLMSDYLAAAEGINVVKTIYMEVDVEPSQQLAEAEYVIELCRRDDNPMVAAVISGRPSSADFASYVTRFKGHRYIKGVRRILHTEQTPRGHCLGETFVKNVQLLGELGLRFDLCMRPGELDDAAKLIAACPGTRFVLDHCGNANVQQDLSAWKRAIDRIAGFDNVICKVSGFIVTAKKGEWTADDLAPVILHVWDAFGPQRIVFGSDWPVCTLTATYRSWFEALVTIVRDKSARDQRRLFHDNAVRWYELAT